MTKKYAGQVRILDTENYPNLQMAAGSVVPCVIEKFDDGDFLYHVYPISFKAFGCDVGTCSEPFPFYDNEVEVISEG